jgi:hypothetical protein
MMVDTSLKQKLLHHIRHPVDLPPRIVAGIQSFLLATVGLPSLAQGAPVEWGRAYRWKFCFDEKGNPVRPDPLQTPFEKARARTKMSISVSRCGPYVTAESYGAEKHSDGRVDWVEERPISPRSTQLARSVAERFDLTYLDAEELYAWELDSSVADEAGIDLEASEPSGFTLLFYGY